MVKIKACHVRNGFPVTEVIEIESATEDLCHRVFTRCPYYRCITKKFDPFEYHYCALFSADIYTKEKSCFNLQRCQQCKDAEVKNDTETA